VGGLLAEAAQSIDPESIAGPLIARGKLAPIERPAFASAGSEQGLKAREQVGARFDAIRALV
jgi:hypothetical protein